MDLKFAMSLIQGSAPLPDDLDEPTRIYINELIELAKKTPDREGKSFEITRSTFVNFWKGVNEHTQPSVSGHHYGFYKAASKCKFVSDAHAKQLTLVCRSGVPPPRWLLTLQLLL